MSLQALTNSNQVIGELRAVFESDDVVDPFTMRRLANEVEKLLAVDAASAYLGKALLAVLQRDIAEARRHAANYLNLTASAAAHANAATIYRGIGDSSAAAARFIEAHAKAAQDTEFVENIAFELICLGRYAAAEGMLARLNRRTSRSEELLDSVRDDMQAISEAEVDLTDVVAQVDIAYGVAQAQNVVPHLYGLQAASDEGRRSVLIALGVKGDADLEYSLEYQLAEKLSALPSWAPERLNVAFECR